MISAIIPTMWFHTETLVQIVDKLSQEESVDEIIIISNNKQDQQWNRLNLSKVVKVEPKKNLGCNPSWNVGAIMATNDKLLILNDDFYFDFSICSKIEPHITEDTGMIGTNPRSFHGDGPVRLVPSRWPEPLPSGFACGFFIHRNVFLQHIIPHILKLHCGDNWLLDTIGKQHYLIYGISFPTTFSNTIPKVRALDTSHPLYIDSTQDELLYPQLVNGLVKYIKEYKTEVIVL